MKKCNPGRDASLTSTQRLLIEKERQIVELEQTLAALRSSTSWKLTASLRSAVTFLRNMRDAVKPERRAYQEQPTEPPVTHTQEIVVQPPPPSKLEKILACIDKSGRGLEIGPSYNPMLPKKKGFNVETLDHATAEALRKKYGPQGVDVSNIEEVDYVWNGEPLDQLTQKRDHFDFIVASHVIEHTPDLISFIQQCQNMLKPNGILSLAVPDRRFCFDRFRPNSSTGDILQAFFEKRRRHTIGAVFDHYSMFVKLNDVIVWTPGTIGQYAFQHTIEEVLQMMEKAAAPDGYCDVHAWRFTPSMFRLLIYDLNMLGYITMGEACFFPTEGHEFFLSLRKGPFSPVLSRIELAEKAIEEHSEF